VGAPVGDGDRAGRGVGAAAGVGELVGQPVGRHAAVGVGAGQPGSLDAEALQQVGDPGAASRTDVVACERQHRGGPYDIGAAVGAGVGHHQGMHWHSDSRRGTQQRVDAVTQQSLLVVRGHDHADARDRNGGTHRRPVLVATESAGGGVRR
jgi:hypothetical protein